MPLHRTLLYGLLAAVLFSPVTAKADVTQADADKLRAELTDWFVSLFGPDPKGRTELLDVVAEGDHFVVSDHSDPVDATGKPRTSPAPHISVIVKPLDTTRWAILGVHIPAPNAANGVGPSPVFVEGNGLLDPTLTTPSHFDFAFHNLGELAPDKGKTEHTDFGPLTVHVGWVPATDGRVVLQWDIVADDMKVAKPTPSGEPEVTTLGRFTSHTRIDDFQFDAAGKMVRAFAAIGRAHAPDAPPVSPSPSSPVATGDRTAAHDLLAAMQDLSTGFEQETAMINLRSGTIAQSGSFTKFDVAIGGNVAKGDLAAHVASTLDGFDSPQIPPGIVRTYLPRHVVLKTSLTGIPAQTAYDLINQWIDHGDPDQLQMERLATDALAKGPVEFAVDEFSLDLGPGHLTASGAVMAVSTSSAYAQATVRVTGADKITSDANTNPELKPVAPALIFLKGLAKQDGDALIWNISYKDKRLLVNETDLSSMVH
jgi:hypothetical protein